MSKRMKYVRDDASPDHDETTITPEVVDEAGSATELRRAMGFGADAAPIPEAATVENADDDDVTSWPLALPIKRVGPLSPWAGRLPAHRRLSTSLDLASQAGKVAAFNATILTDHDSEEMLGRSDKSETFAVRDWLTVDASARDEKTGHYRRFVRTVLIGPDGTRYGSTSDWVLAALVSIEGHFGLAPWAPPLNIRFVSGRGKVGRFYSLEVV